MEYKGKLYGRVSKKYIPLKMTSEQVDAMQDVVDAVALFDKDNIEKDCGNPNCPECRLKRMYAKYKETVNE